MLRFTGMKGLSNVMNTPATCIRGQDEPEGSDAPAPIEDELSGWEYTPDRRGVYHWQRI